MGTLALGHLYVRVFKVKVLSLFCALMAETRFAFKYELNKHGNKKNDTKKRKVIWWL